MLTIWQCLIFLAVDISVCLSYLKVWVLHTHTHTHIYIYLYYFWVIYLLNLPLNNNAMHLRLHMRLSVYVHWLLLFTPPFHKVVCTSKCFFFSLETPGTKVRGQLRALLQLPLHGSKNVGYEREREFLLGMKGRGVCERTYRFYESSWDLLAEEPCLLVSRAEVSLFELCFWAPPLCAAVCCGFFFLQTEDL